MAARKERINAAENVRADAESRIPRVRNVSEGGLARSAPRVHRRGWAPMGGC